MGQFDAAVSSGGSFVVEGAPPKQQQQPTYETDKVSAPWYNVPVRPKPPEYTDDDDFPNLPG